MKIYQYVIENKIYGNYFSFDENGRRKFVRSINKAALFETREDAEFECDCIPGERIKKLTFVLQEKGK